MIRLAQASSSGFTNPLGDVTIADALVGLVWIMLGFVGILAIAGIVYGGIRIIISLGSSSGVETGKKAIFYSIMGLIVVALSALIVGLVSHTLGIKGAPK